MIVGVAAHITAASPGGPRYNPALTPEERSHAANGIWLCGIHGKAVDSDAEHFTVEMLRKWKQQAEENSLRTILTLTKSQATGTNIAIMSGTADLTEPEGEVSSILGKSVTAAKDDLEAFKRGTS